MQRSVMKSTVAKEIVHREHGLLRYVQSTYSSGEMTAGIGPVRGEMDTYVPVLRLLLPISQRPSIRGLTVWNFASCMICPLE